MRTNEAHVVAFTSLDLPSPQSLTQDLLHSGCVMHRECGLYHTASYESYRPECMDALFPGALVIGHSPCIISCPGCRNRVSLTGWLKQQRRIFTRFWRLEV